MTEERSVPQAVKVDPDELILGPLRTKHGPLKSWNVPEFGLVVVALPPDPEEFDQFLNLVKRDDVDSAHAVRTFALNRVVHPDRDTLARIVKRYPLFPLKLAAGVQKLAGADIEETGKG